MPSGIHMLGRKLPLKTRKKMSKNRSGSKHWLFGKHHKPESNEKNRIAHLGQLAWNKGKKTSDEVRKKISIAHKGIPMHPNTRQAIIKSLKGNTHTLGIKMPQSMREKTSKRLMGNKINLGRVMDELVKQKISESNKGEKSHSWKGGITPLNNKIRGSKEYNDWERAILSRDIKCQKCGYDKKSKLVAHHILNFSSYPELRFDLNNGITFCRIKCHKEFHRIYGIKNNNRVQLQEFLSKNHE